MGLVSLAQPGQTSPTPPPLCGSSPPLKGRGLFAAEATLLCGQCALLLGWRPNEFWASTPADLACVLSALNSHSDDPVDSACVAQMMELFPDAPTGDK